MKVREVTASRRSNGGWSFKVAGGPVDAVSIVVADEAGAIVWSVISDAFGEQTYTASVEVLEEREMVNLDDVSEEEVAADLVARGCDPEAVADRSAVRALSAFDYGTPPSGFRAQAEWPPMALLRARRYGVMIFGNFAFPVAAGSFTM